MATPSMTYKDYELTSHSTFPASKIIRPQGQGSVPLMLRGMYTSFTACKNAIDQYIPPVAKEVAPTKEPTDAKVKSKRGSKSVRTGTDNGGEQAKLSA